MLHYYTALTLPLRLLLHSHAFYPATLQAPSLDHFKHEKHEQQHASTVRTDTMMSSHVPPVAAQSLVFVLDGSCLQSLRIYTPTYAVPTYRVREYPRVR